MGKYWKAVVEYPKTKCKPCAFMTLTTFVFRQGFKTSQEKHTVLS